MIIDNLKWVSEPSEILEVLKQHFPNLTFTSNYLHEYKNLEIAELGEQGKILVKFDKSEKVTIICDFSEVTKIFTVEN